MNIPILERFVIAGRKSRDGKFKSLTMGRAEILEFVEVVLKPKKMVPPCFTPKVVQPGKVMEFPMLDEQLGWRLRVSSEKTQFDMEF